MSGEAFKSAAVLQENFYFLIVIIEKIHLFILKKPGTGFPALSFEPNPLLPHAPEAHIMLPGQSHGTAQASVFIMNIGFDYKALCHLACLRFLEGNVTDD